MRTALSKLSIIIVMCILLVSCGEDTNEDSSVQCATLSDALLTLDPVCSFDPRSATTVQFPVKALLDGTVPSYDLYEYSWSKDPEFKGSAISVNYDQLPLLLILTEISTGCTTETTLENDYWD